MKSENTDLKCGLCKKDLCVPPVQCCDSKRFMCGVCYDSRLYYPDAQREKLDKVIPQKLYDLYVESQFFPCGYNNCSQLTNFGQACFEHMKYCPHRSFSCPVSDINKYYAPLDYNRCDFESTDTVELYSHIEKSHPDLIVKNKINSKEFWRRPHGLFVLEDKAGVISVIYIDKVIPNSLRISCRQIRSRVSDKCVIEVNMGRKKEKYVINCSEYLGALKKKGQKLLKYVTVDDNPIYFSIVPEKEDVTNVTSDTEDYLPPLGNNEMENREVNEDWMVLRDDELEEV
ncbi:uncharacterized protein LOC123321363 isoform X2 [Coccinella septempunctata]|uniref:uncharacterized protein LOC123321363 isoform X2 n=1 Tax=Coccinella septempunctata TaxID=41139 RepID=UPI001D08F617|nr:uncharacterized protein LOC123321363 isoform X2 [Coccinella septempunctata]